MSWLHKVLVTCSALFDEQIKRDKLAQQKADRIANSLTLYTLNTCPYSAKVQRHLHHLNVSPTVKNLKRCHIYQKELLAGGGRAQVPCLRIESADKTQWLYESDDIIRYLDKKFMPKQSIRSLESSH